MMDLERMPAHVAIVMDGNGRWASARSLPRLSGHNAGMTAMKEIVKRASALNIKHLTVYAFSTENWKRSAEEVSGIFKLLILYVDKELAELHANHVKVRILGAYEQLPADVVRSLEKSVRATAENTGLQFNIALNYGSRAEIVRAVQSLAEDARSGRIGADAAIEEAEIAERLYTSGIPDPDLVIRTSGEKRLSNFLLWQSAYSEFVFSEVLWPDFSPAEFDKAIEEFQGRDRRFGGRQRQGR
ncbi:MAG: isoprenyl transferase [Clostridiales Family XIII bacterium]|jgi:undecaprenyl diphosphate synthase|nr:isoprenyl transferase [Clostridiales Family XIII bacterium]